MSEPPAARTHVRWVPILALVATGTMINYLDRTVLGIAAPLLSHDLALDAARMGLVFSAFSWSYAILQIPGGIVLDRLGTRTTYALALGGWSFFTGCMGLVRSLPSLLLTRIGVGVFEAPCFPANSRIMATWFPQRERARGNAVYSFGQYVGLGFLSAPLFWVTRHYGWRVLFLIVGGAGILFAAAFWRLYRDIGHDQRANAAERAYIEAGGGGEARERTPAFRWSQIRALLRQRQVVGASIGQFGGNSTQVFFLTWFPTYLVTARHMDYIKAGFMASLPYVAASAGVVVGGVLSDALLSRTGSANLARKLPVVAGLCLASVIVAANYVPADGNTTVMLIMSAAFFGQGMTNLGWTVVSDIAPKPLIGLTSGIFNFTTNVAGIVTPLVIGFTYQMTGSFVGPLVYIGLVALVGAFSYIVILGDIRRLQVDTGE
ncbi:MAG TPA: MFS transporter [Vicinamibacterales bacterium]